MNAAARIVVRLANEPDHDGDYAARVWTVGPDLGDKPSHDRTFFDRDRQAALDRATAYAAWLRNRDASEEVIEL